VAPIGVKLADITMGVKPRAKSSVRPIISRLMAGSLTNQLHPPVGCESSPDDDASLKSIHASRGGVRVPLQLWWRLMEVDDSTAVLTKEY
jgi:hypothetical protein